jgi:hypothetical protein
MPYGAAEPRAVLFVQHGPVGRLFPRDPERCLHLKRAALLEGAAHEPEEVREGALRALEKIAASELETIDDRQDRLFLFALRDGVPAGGGGGGTAAQVGRTGMHSTSILRRDGRVGRDVEGLVPDGVAEVEIVAHGAPPRGWVRRHRLRVRGNYFRLPYFHAESFELRWLDARGREVPHGPP